MVQTQDFIKGYDPTLNASISPAQLAQMVDAATPATDKGLWVTTTDAADGTPEVPDASEATGDTKLQNYGWKRISANAVSIYVWNPNTANNVVYRKWVNIITAQFAPQTIPASALINASITDTQINSISSSKITGLATVLPPTGAAGGDLTGTYPNPTIDALKVTGGSAAGKIAAVTINDYNIANVGITATTKLVLGAANVILKMKSDGSVWEYKDYITGNGLKNLRVNAGATDFEAFTPTFAKAMYSGLAANALDNAAQSTSGTTNAAVQFAHGLGAQPSYYKVVLQCIAGSGGDNGYSELDEVELWCVKAGSAYVQPEFVVVADATNVTVIFRTGDGGGTGFKLTKKDASAYAVLTYTKWKFKAYAAI